MTVKKYFKSTLRTKKSNTYYILNTANKYYKICKRTNRVTYEQIPKSKLPSTLIETSNDT